MNSGFPPFVKILCTLGPASSSPEVIRNLLVAGANAFRVNFSHGTQESNGELIRLVRSIAGELNLFVPIVMDLQGPKIRVGKFQEGAVTLKKDAPFVITTEQVAGDVTQVSTTYTNLPHDVKPQDHLYLDDGLIRLVVESTDGVRILCRVVEGGELKNNKGINLIGSTIRLPALTDKDKADLQFGCRAGVDYVALSFVRSPDDLKEARSIMDRLQSRAWLVAKIERPEALDVLDDIIVACDGIMIARGDLGVELPPEEIPVLQKDIIRRVSVHSKLVITATQMMESMVSRPRPTRAEASDVANAVLDGTDVVMLSAETASGAYPVQTVEVMRRVIKRVEQSLFWRDAVHGIEFTASAQTVPGIIGESAAKLAKRHPAKCVATFTLSGATGRIMSSRRPGKPIYCFSPNQRVLRQLSLHWGIEGAACPVFDTTEEMIHYLEEGLLARGKVERDDLVVFVSGSPVGQTTRTNFLKLHRIGERDF
jgi:pyruvate kinase